MALYRYVAGSHLGLAAFDEPITNDISGGSGNSILSQYSQLNQYDPSGLNTAPILTADTIDITPTGPVLTPRIPVPPTGADTALPTNISAVPTTTTTTNDSQKNFVFPLLTLAGLFVIAVKGEDILKKKRKIAFVGGLGVLYYLLQKQ